MAPTGRRDVTLQGGFVPGYYSSSAVFEDDANFAQHLQSVIHGVRLALGAGGGTMPRVIAGEQRAPRLYAAGGATLCVALGAK